MKTSYASAIVLAISALAAGHASAEDRHSPNTEIVQSAYSANAESGKTRAQVQSELAEAQRTGDILALVGGKVTGQKLNQISPEQYASVSPAQGKTRAQVLSELAEAQRTGDIVAIVGGKVSGIKQNQLPEQLDSAN